MLLGASVPACVLDGANADGQGCASVDIGVDADGLIAFVSAAGQEAPTPWPRVSLDGRQVWPGLVELHAHIDKAGTAGRASSPDGTLEGAREAAKRDRLTPWSREDAWTRMDWALQAAFSHGTVALRTHLDSQQGRTEPTWSIWPELRDHWAGRIALQAVATLGVHKLAGAYGEEICERAARTGARLGPVVYASPDLDLQLNRAFDLADRFDLELDFHVDETDDPEARGLRRIAQLALERGFARQIVCGHACSLSRHSDEEAGETIALVRQAGIGVVSLPANNLYLQGRSPGRTPTWRGVTRIKELRAAGVPVAIGGDNCQDAFYPFGDNDLVDVFRDAVRIAHLDYPFAGWVEAVSATPAALMGLEGRGRIAPGSPADMIIFGETSTIGVLATPGRRRVVVRSGRSLDAPD